MTLEDRDELRYRSFERVDWSDVRALLPTGALRAIETRASFDGSLRMPAEDSEVELAVYGAESGQWALNEILLACRYHPSDLCQAACSIQRIVVR